MRTLDPAVAVPAARQGDRRALARLITAVEERGPHARTIAREFPAVGASHVVGITGAPGVGKSTTTAVLIRHWRLLGRRVAVIAVDPSSPFTGGALLGDRIRMTEHSLDEGVFIRSMAARGQLGGLSAATPAAARILAGCGYDMVVIETVGVGQSEIDIVRHADTVLILMAPGMGDRIQANKAGLLEIGDVIAVNKSDRPGAAATRRELRAMISAKPIPVEGWRPPVLALTAADGAGVPELGGAIDEHLARSRAGGELRARRTGRAAAEVVSLAQEVIAGRIDSHAESLADLAERVAAGGIDSYAAADDLLRDIGLAGDSR